MPESKGKMRFPFAFWVCGFTELFERLAYYLGRSLILVFVTATVASGGLGLSDVTAAKMQSNLTAFSYLAALFGGVIVDKWIGARYTTPIGIFIVAVGYYIGSLAHSASMIYVMIFCVCFGLALDKTGPIIGRSVTPDTLKSAYSVRYSLTNIGAFFGPFLVGILYTKVFAHGTVQGFLSLIHI